MSNSGTTIIEDEILGVEPKEVTRKSDGRRFTFYECRLSDSTVYSTMNVEIANEAAEYAGTGKRVRLSVKIEDDGRFIKRYINQVIGEVFAGAPAPTNGQAPTTQAPTGFIPPKALPEASSVTNNTAVSAPDDLVDRARKTEDERQRAIERQCATKVAAMLASPGESQLDFWTNVQVLQRFYAEGVKPLAVEIQMDDQRVV